MTDDIDIALTEACLHTSREKPILEIAMDARVSLIKHINSGDIGEKKVPEEFRQYLPELPAEVSEKRRLVFGFKRKT